MKTMLMSVALIALSGCGAEMAGTKTSTPSVQAASPPPTQSSPVGLVTAPVEKYAPAVFVGDSITYLLHTALPDVDRDAGVPSDTTAMMLARFQADALDYHPAVVVILGGVNDIRKQYGTDLPFQNVAQMAQNAAAAGACVILGTVMPVAHDSWTTATKVTPTDGDAQVAEYNQKMRALAASYGYHIVDYHSAFVLSDGTQNAALFLPDGLHPNDDGVAVMWKTVQPQLTACGLAQ